MKLYNFNETYKFSSIIDETSLYIQFLFDNSSKVLKVKCIFSNKKQQLLPNTDISVLGYFLEF